MHIINFVMFVLVCMTGDIGTLLLWAVIWFPIAASIKLEYHINMIGRKATAGKVQKIGVEGGGSIKVSSVDSGSADLTVGMSMGEP